MKGKRAIAKRLANNLKQRRGADQQDEFAKRIGVSRATVNRLENECQNVTLKTLETIAVRLKCDVMDLLDW